MSVATTAYRFFRQFLHDRDRGLCGICARPVELGPKMDVDHVVQLAEGGSDDPSNLRITHAQCNRKRPRIAGRRIDFELDRGTALGLREWADSENFEVVPFVIHTLRRLVEEREARPRAPRPAPADE